MKKIYHLSTCNTCKRIIETITPNTDVIMQDLKSEPVTPNQLNDLYDMAGSYESLFNRRSRLYQQRDLKNKELQEEDYKNLILEHYTFLKRPVMVVDDQIFIGNSKKVVEAAKIAFHE